MRVALRSALSGEEKTAPVGRAPPAKRRRRVLVVHAGPMVGLMLHNVLSGEHDVDVLAGANCALERLSAGQRYDVILCDMMMPVASGIDFYEALRETAPERANRIVFLTGGAFTARAREFLDCVSNPRVEKPFEVPGPRAPVDQ